MNCPKVGKYELRVDPFHADVSLRLKAGMLGNHLLNCAAYHAAQRGFDRKTVDGEYYLWVLSRFVIDIYEIPREYEMFSIETWIESIYRFFTNRNFAVYNAEGRAVAYARSVWAAIGAESRKPADLIKVHGEQMKEYVTPDKECPVERATRHKIDSDEPTTIWVPKYGDIDSNGHVNSMKYIDYILDLFPLELYREKQVHRIEIAYNNEALYGEKIQVFMQEEKDSEFVVEMKSENREAICSSKIIFK